MPWGRRIPSRLLRGAHDVEVGLACLDLCSCERVPRDLALVAEAALARTKPRLNLGPEDKV